MVDIDSGFGVGTTYLENRSFAVGLEIEPRNQLVSQQQREHEVPVLALRLGHVDLDAVVEAEEAQRTAAIPDERVERRQERGVRSRRTLRTRVRQRVRGLAPPVDRHLDQFARLDELRHALARYLRVDHVVTGEIAHTRPPRGHAI